MRSVRGKVVLITGGARGVGAATAELLVERGAKVVLVDIDPGPLEQLAARLGDASSAWLVGDVTVLGDMEAAVELARERFGALDVVLANAGIAAYGSVAKVDPEMFRRLIDINVTGVFHTVRAAMSELVRARGYVLVVASAAAYAPAPGLGAYDASKAAAEHLANAMRLELGHLGVAVGSAHMSWIDTPMVQDARRDLASFEEMMASLPGPLSATTSVQACADAFVRGIERRSARVNVPGWVEMLRWAKPLLTSRLFELAGRGDARRLMPMMDEEVERLGRSASERVTLPGHDREPA